MTTTYTSSLGVGTPRTTGIATQTLNTVSRFAGAEIDNSVNLDEQCDIVLLFTLAATPTAGDPIKVYILYAMDGTNYEDGIPTTNDGAHDDGYAANPSAQVASIGTLAVATAQKMTLRGIGLRPYKFKLMIYNGTTKSCTSLLTVLLYGTKGTVAG